MTERDVIIGNLTTILMWIFSTIGGGAIIKALGGSSQAIIIIGAFLGLGYSILNAYFPNHLNILNNNKEVIEDVADSISNCDCDEDCDEDCGGNEE